MIRYEEDSQCVYERECTRGLRYTAESHLFCHGQVESLKSAIALRTCTYVEFVHIYAHIRGWEKISASVKRCNNITKQQVPVHVIL